jgi:hypothetical protein
VGTILFLFRRKFFYSARFALLVTGYDIKRRDFVEELYGLYVAIILAGWVVLMAGFAVTSLAQSIATVHLPVSGLQTPLFFGLALWLAITPWLAQRSYDLYRFSLADLDFLSSAPLRPSLVAVFWFFKSLLTRLNGAVVLGFGVLAGAIGQISGRGDLLGLVTGVFAAGAFVVTAFALLWVLCLLRYRPIPAFGAVQGYALSALLVVPLVMLPARETLFWPASLVSGLVAAPGAGSDWLSWASGVLVATALLGVAALWLVARGTLLAPAFEEGRLGGQLRRSAGGLAASDARVQAGLERRLARGGSFAGSLAGEVSQGVLSVLWLKQKLRLSRMPVSQLLISTIVPVLLGALVAATMLFLPRVAMRVEILAPAAFFACFALIRSGIAVLRADFAHIDFFVGMPVSRLHLAIYDTFAGFVLPLIGGEAAVLGFFPTIGLSLTLLWLLAWPLLIAATAALALLDFLRLLKKWPATPETLPEVGPAPMIAAAVIWLLAVWGLSSVAAPPLGLF